MTRARWLATVALFALVAAACSSGTPSGTSTPTTDQELNTPQPGGGRGTTQAVEPDEGSPGPNEQPTSEETTSAPAPTVSRTQPPLPGTYRYAQDGETRAGVFTIRPDDEGTLDIDPAEGNRQRQLRTYSSNSSQEQVLLYRRGGVFLESFVSRFATTEVSCDLRDPIKIVDTPLELDSSWKGSSSCDDLTMSVTGTVTKQAQRDVGGETVDTFVVRLTVTAKGDDLDQTSTSRLWISEEHRVVVRAVESSEGTADGQRFTSSRTDDLLSLEPQ